MVRLVEETEALWTTLSRCRDSLVIVKHTMSSSDSSFSSSFSTAAAAGAASSAAAGAAATTNASGLARYSFAYRRA